MNRDSQIQSTEPTVSVLLPVYEPNYSWLETAIESVLEQTFESFELVIVDDGSSNPVREELDEYIIDKDKVHLYRQSNRGFAGATNRAFRESAGRYVAPIGQDDSWNPEKLERQVEFLRSGYDAVFAKAKKIDVNGEVVGERGTFPSGNLLMELFQNCYPCYESVVFDKHLIADDWMVNEDFIVASDWDLWFRLFPKADIKYIDDYLLSSRSHENQTTYRHYDDAVEEGERILRKYADDFELPEQQRQQVFTRFYRSKATLLYRLGFESEAIKLYTSIQYIDNPDVNMLRHRANYAEGRESQQEGRYTDALHYFVIALRHRFGVKPLAAITLTPYFWIRRLCRFGIRRLISRISELR
jgi:glycosyltransferase involved in cell wall biosynthesis